ncbi:hypothetical protein DPMN_073827 [Dreissena polymorpha]|uniref:Uncharacterized protein n=1 Tax=Dreissena polymorpha TaxID=45954 RepID=A0A9D4BZT6_DREPO|nr:hypothetical protein DPMN_073827 [Dreissena polymorpha]
MSTINIIDINRVTDIEATNRLFTKLKYDIGIQITSRLIQSLKQSKDRVLFYVGKEQRSYPAAIVKMFTHVKANHVKIPLNYSVQELMNVFEILMNLSDYQCNGLTQDYSDWQSISSLVNMMELGEFLGMTEVVMFLKRIPQLLTLHNKNAYDNEFLRRENESKENQKPMSVNEPSENDEKRSRTRKRSFTKVFSRSLSRKRREENVMN